MAYEVKLPDDEDQQQAQAGVPALAPGGMGLGGGAPQPASTQPDSGSKFVNFDRVLAANKDGATASANQLAGTLQTQAQGAQTAAAGVVDQFGKAVAGGAPASPRDQSVSSNITGVAGGRQPQTTAVTGIPSNRTSVQAGPSGRAAPVGRVAGQYDHLDYTGPNDISKFAGFDDAMSKVGKSDADLAVLGSKGGLDAFAKQQAGGGNYTQGMQQMDAALLGATGRGQFDALAQKYGNLGKTVDEQNTKAQGQVGDARGRVDKFNAEQDGFRSADEANAAAKVAAGAPAADDAARAAAIHDGISTGYLKNYTRGAWGQVDPFGNGDARRYQENLKQAGIDMPEAEQEQVFRGMTDDEYREFRWLAEGKSAASGIHAPIGGGWGVEHPDTTATGDYKKSLAAFMAKMKKQYAGGK